MTAIKNGVLIKDYAKNGAVYTPHTLAEYVSYKTVEYFFNSNDRKVKEGASEPITIMDPACGDGILLETIWGEFHKKFKRSGTRYLNFENKIKIFGMDIDENAIENSKKRLAETINTEKNDVFRFINTNALLPFGKKNLSKGYEEINKKLGHKERYDILIANPPWGADITSYRDKLDKNEFKTLSKQVDSYELFIELALKIVKPDGYFSFIIPDSILNHGKNNLREMLLKNTQIKFISRMGEKIFPGINRSNVVLICKNSRPNKYSKVDCFRLNKKQRKLILDNELTFLEAEKKNKHKVKQERFFQNQECLFDIDLKESESDIIKKINNTDYTLRSYLTNSRGIELSGKGRICKCPSCEKWMPYPKKQFKKCPSCKTEIDLRKCKQEHIVTSKKTKNSVKLINGSEIKRYQLTPRNWLKLGFDGINYKDERLYKDKKLIIRKTGVGVSASIDNSDSYTTQVVYIFKLKDNIPCEITLEFILSLINSRAYYFYLTKSFGENEWRSYPYLTQNQILDLPIPKLNSENRKKIAKEISQLIGPYVSNNLPSPKDIDASIEYLISKLLRLDQKDYEIIYETIHQSQDLLPVKALKNITTEEIFKK